MATKVQPIPEGYAGATPYLIVDDGNRALDFYKKAFGAEELFRIGAPGEKIGHAEIKLSGGVIMVADEFPDMGAVAPKSLGGSPVSLVVYVEDVDRLIERALAAGATLVSAAENKFYGDRMGTLKDPFGHSWHFATHVEDVPPDELERRAAAMHK